MLQLGLKEGEREEERRREKEGDRTRANQAWEAAARFEVSAAPRALQQQASPSPTRRRALPDERRR